MKQPLPFRSTPGPRVRRLQLDHADRAALTTLGSYALTLCLVLLALLLVSVALGLCVRLFLLGVG